MKILAIDTSSNICGVSILENNNIICQLDKNTGRTHSENLMPMIQQAFKISNLNLKDIDLLICDKGPGSFTGIRIGIATVKAFHDSLSIPYIGVSSLETLAYSIKTEGLICSIIDCKNDNCYFSIYRLKDSQYNEIITPSTDTITNALKICQKHYLSDFPITFVGDGSEVYKSIISSVFKDCIFAIPENNLLNSYRLGLVGLNKYKKNEFDDVLPLYLKKPQAQKQQEEKSKEIEVTPMTFEDLNQIADTLTSDFDEFWSYSVLNDELNSTTSNYIVAKLNQKIVGFAGIKILLDEANIMNMVVKKDFRNQGIGTLLLENLLLLTQKLKLSSITLEVMEENYPAIHLYKKFGFVQVGIRKNYYQEKNGLIMTKKLPLT